MNNKTKWITKTAVMIALLVVLQAVTKGLGQFVTGSCVNFILATTALICGLSSGLTVAVLSPFFAFLFGIGPAFLPIVPGICAGNAVLVLVLWFILKKNDPKTGIARKALAIICGAVLKFALLNLLVTKVILPMLPLNEKQVTVLSASFAWPQLVTALIGSILAVLLWPRLKKAIK